MNEKYKVCWEHTRKPKFIYEFPFRISKPYNAESGFENSVRKVTNHTHLRLVY